MNEICKNCEAKCCKGFWIVVELYDDLENYLKFHGCIIVNDKVFIPLRCKHLSTENKCKVYYEKRKPKICDKFKCTLLDGKEQVPPEIMPTIAP